MLLALAPLLVGDGSLPPGVTSHEVDGQFAGASAIVLADLDGDGRKDIASAGQYADSFTWWRNGAHGSWQRHDVLELNGAATLRAADLDGDGDTDLYGTSIATSPFGEDTVWWLENRLELAPGQAPSFTAHLVGAFPNEDPESIDAADMDGDGTLDLVLSLVYDPAIRIYRNLDGTAQNLAAGLQVVPLAGLNGVSWVRAVDFDRDGDTDLVATTPWDWNGASHLYWIPNEGGAVFGERVIIAGGPQFNGTFTAAIGDLNGDGHDDVVTATSGSWGNVGVHWVRRLDAEGTSWSAPILLDDDFFGSTGEGSLIVADVDQDGRMDVLGGSDFVGPTLRLWLNRGHGRFRCFDVEQGFGARGIAVGDLEGDGIDEIVAGAYGTCCYTGQVKLWRAR